MRKLSFLLVTLGLLMSVTSQAQAEGCLKGALVGGVAGHLKHHAVAGAVAGCAAGHYLAKKHKEEDSKQSH